MSGEHLAVEKFIDASSNSANITSQNDSTLKKIPARVNINKLMLNLREKEKKQKKENWVFLGLISSVVIITGVMASL